MTANTPTETNVSNDEEQQENNGYVESAIFGANPDNPGRSPQEDEDGDDKSTRDVSTSADFTDQFDDNLSDEDRDTINRNIDIVEHMEEIVEREDGLDIKSGPHRVAADWGDDDDVTPELVLTLIEDEFVVDGDEDKVVRRKTGMDRVQEADESGGVCDWLTIQNLYHDDKGRGRLQATEKLDEEYSWMYVIDESQDFEDFRYYDAEKGIYVGNAKKHLACILDDHLGKYFSTHEVNEIAARLRARNHISLQEANAGDAPLCCVQNGVLNIESWELLPHSPEYYFTRRLNGDWDEYADTSAVEAFIRDITGSESDALVIEEMLGDTLSKHYKRQWFGLLYGDGANGKSVLLSCLRTVLGSKNVSAESLHDIAETRWSGAAIAGEYGSLANIDPDIEARKIHDAASIKNLTGGDATSMERKGRDKFDAVNLAKMLFAANTPPIFAERMNAIVRRIKPVKLPFTYKPASEVDPSDPFEKVRDSDLEEKLTTPENRSAWLKVMAVGLERLRALDGFSFEKSQEELFANYQAEADTLWSFLNECVENRRIRYSDDDSPVHLTVEELHSMYAAYCHERDERAMDESTFGREINRTGLHEMESFRPRRTGQVAARKFLVPTEAGWKYARTSTKERFELHVDEIEVPAPDSDNDCGAFDADRVEAGTPADERDREMPAEELVVREIPGQMMRDAGGPTVASLAGATGLSRDETRAAVGLLLVDGRVERVETDGGDVEYHTAAVADGGESR